MVFGIAGARDANLGRVEDCFRAKTEGARNHRPQRKATEAAAAAEATRTTKALSTTKPIGGVSKQHPFLSRCTCDAPRPSTLRPEARVRSKLLYGRSSIAVAVSRVRFKGFFRLLICAVRTNSGAGGGVRQRACNDPCPAALPRWLSTDPKHKNHRYIAPKHESVRTFDNPITIAVPSVMSQVCFRLPPARETPRTCQRLCLCCHEKNNIYIYWL